MKLPRRKFLHLAAGAAALPALPRVAQAQAYPTRPVRIIAPTGPGGAPDIIARLIAPWLSQRLGQQFVVENRPGSGNNIGTEAVVRAAPDGYTLLIVSSSNTINATLYDKLNFVFLRDIATVAGIISLPFVMVVNPSVPAKTVPEFIAHAKANPGKISFGSPGSGTGPHMAGEPFKLMTGVRALHVSYRGSAPMLNDLLSGQVQFAFDGIASSIGHIRAGRLRALGVGNATRVEALPDVPAVAEFVPGYEAGGTQGVGVPRKTPVEIIEKLNREINAGLADPRMRTRITDLGNTPLALSAAEYSKLLAEETEKWGEVVKFAGIKPE
jgi:tripartite-type tricarboxylate transporter receptor subunit TctC